MKPGKPSSTAIGACAARAAHFLVYGGSPIFEDRFALSLTGLVLDAIVANELLAPEERVFNEVAAARSAARCEPWLSTFDPIALEQQLAATGFSSVERLTPELAAARYYAGQPAGVTPLHAWQMFAATV